MARDNLVVEMHLLLLYHRQNALSAAPTHGATEPDGTIRLCARHHTLYAASSGFARSNEPEGQNRFMKVCVCVKHIPDPTMPMVVDPGTKRLVRDRGQSI